MKPADFGQHLAQPSERSPRPGPGGRLAGTGGVFDVIAWIREFSKGDSLALFWKLFRLRAGTRQPLLRQVLTFLLNRMAHRHGGYIGNGAVFRGIPILPHGLHGVFISRYAKIGAGCWIYQNVTIGEVDRAAPEIGDGCLIGAGAVIASGVKIGNRVKIGAGAVVCVDVPDGCTVVAQPPRVIWKEARYD